jgi:hypothetical protein
VQPRSATLGLTFVGRMSIAFWKPQLYIVDNPRISIYNEMSGLLELPIMLSIQVDIYEFGVKFAWKVGDVTMLKRLAGEPGLAAGNKDLQVI